MFVRNLIPISDERLKAWLIICSQLEPSTNILSVSGNGTNNPTCSVELQCSNKAISHSIIILLSCFPSLHSISPKISWNDYILCSFEGRSWSPGIRCEPVPKTATYGQMYSVNRPVIRPYPDAFLITVNTLKPPQIATQPTVNPSSLSDVRFWTVNVRGCGQHVGLKFQHMWVWLS